MEFYDVRELDGYTTSIVYDNGEVDEISEHFMTGGAVRALSGGSFGFTSIDDVKKMDAAIKDAVAIARRLPSRTPLPSQEGWTSLIPGPPSSSSPYRK